MASEPRAVRVITVRDVVRDTNLLVRNRQKLLFEVREMAEANPAVGIVLDFDGIAYIDSSGLGVLVSVSREVRKAGGDVVVAGLTADLTTLMQLTKVDTLVTLVKTPEDGVRSLQRAGGDPEQVLTDAGVTPE